MGGFFYWETQMMCVDHYETKPRRLHSIVKLNTTCEQKKMYSLKVASPNGSEFYQYFISWVDIHCIYYIVKFGDQICMILFVICFIYKTYRFWLEWRKIELEQLLQKWTWLKISKIIQMIWSMVCICRKKIIIFIINYGI